ncbi:unnamed protein product [Sphenostylis stenocarpa]|uniref:ENTH domain-containing protein n=1 Tax=Sphenostylis stenocarpa TaxID=92480 RepID=A0AA86VCS4_9FABA|nr:unnamed protein product [Sphenostylis stenocarpa]
MPTPQSWKKAYGALKDTTKVGLAHVSSDYADLEVAVVKATNHVECPPKERHLRKILLATSAVRPRADVAYCIHTLSRRLAKTRNWTVALKTLIVIHRLLREGDPTLREEFLNFSRRGRILQLSNFRDDSSPIAWDCSAWVRTYALYLEERLECFWILKYDIEAERLTKPVAGQEKGHSRTRDLNSEELLEQLPALQQLLYCLVGCRPEGAAVSSYVIQFALALVLKESFKIYCAINDGIINLVDKFFEMPKHEAIKAFDVYKRAGQQAESLSDFYEICKRLEIARNFQFPVLREPPQSFLVTMEDYIKDAPRVITVSIEPLLLLTYRPNDVPTIEYDKLSEEQEPSVPVVDVASNYELAPPPPPHNDFETGDLLGLNDSTPDASLIEERSDLALAIVPTETDSRAAPATDFDPTGWELALVSTPCTAIASVNERELDGRLSSLNLNSLYDQGAYRSAKQTVFAVPAPNPFEVQDPFVLSSGNPPPPTVQIGAISQQHINPFAHHQPYQPLQMRPANPFEDAGYGAFPVYPVSHPLSNNPFGSTGTI